MAGGFNPGVSNKKAYFIMDRLHNEPDKEKYPKAKSFDEKEPDYGEARKAAVLAKAEELAEELAKNDAFANKNIIKDGDPVTVKANRIKVDGHSFDGNDGSKKYSFDITIEGKKGGLRVQGIVAANKDGEMTAYANNIKYSDQPDGAKVNDKYIPPKWVDVAEADLAKANLNKAYDVIKTFVAERSEHLQSEFPKIYTDIRDYINKTVPQDYKTVDKESGAEKMVREVYVGAYKVDGNIGNFYINTHSDDSIKFTIDRNTGDYSIDIVSRGEDNKPVFKSIQSLAELDGVKGGKLVQDVISNASLEEVPFGQEDPEQESCEPEMNA